EPVVWLDGLDIPMVAFFDAGFLERYPQERQPVTRDEGDTHARYGSNLLPVDAVPPSLSSPVFSSPYARTREALHRLARGGARHPCDGIRLQYANPAAGAHAMPTIGAFVQCLPAGFRGEPYRGTDGTVYCVVEGRGRTVIDDTAFDWNEKDVFVVPSLRRVRHGAAT